MLRTRPVPQGAEATRWERRLLRGAAELLTSLAAARRRRAGRPVVLEPGRHQLAFTRRGVLAALLAAGDAPR